MVDELYAKRTLCLETDSFRLRRVLQMVRATKHQALFQVSLRKIKNADPSFLTTYNMKWPTELTSFHLPQ